MTKRILAGLAALAVVCAPIAAHAKAVTLEPQSGWALDSDDESCALTRVFDDADGVVQLELRQFKPGGAMQVEVVSDEHRISNRDHMSYRFEPGTEWQDKNWGSFIYFGVQGKFQGAVFDASLLPPIKDPKAKPIPPGDPKLLEQLGAALGTIDGLTVSDVFGDDMTLHTGSLMAPFTALRQCLGKVVTKWGLDPFVQNTLTKIPTAVNPEAVGESVRKAFPPVQIHGENPAMIIQVRLLVDSEGKTTGCSIRGPRPDQGRYKAACKALSSARFEPALDSKGNPVASYWQTHVYYAVKIRGYTGGG